MLGMMATGEERKNRLPLFPGTSCLPLSRGNSIGALDVSAPLLDAA
jgi:hypothetical protein